jgi:hypothetical protein
MTEEFLRDCSARQVIVNVSPYNQGVHGQIKRVVAGDSRPDRLTCLFALAGESWLRTPPSDSGIPMLDMFLTDPRDAPDLLPRVNRMLKKMPWRKKPAAATNPAGHDAGECPVSMARSHRAPVDASPHQPSPLAPGCIHHHAPPLAGQPR